MSLKRFCDLCDAEIPAAERFYNVILRVLSDPDHDSDELDQESLEYCYTCTKSGKALQHVMERYERRLQRERVPA